MKLKNNQLKNYSNFRCNFREFEEQCINKQKKYTNFEIIEIKHIGEYEYSVDVYVYFSYLNKIL